MRSDNVGQQFTPSLATDVYHPLAQKDGEILAEMRKQLAPFKGHMNGPAARASFDEVMEQTPDAPSVSYEAEVVGGIPGLWCRPKGARPEVAILYLHGGAYVLGSPHAYRHFAGQVAARSGAAAFVAGYRLAPEHTFPAAVDDALAAYLGLIELGLQSIAIVGDSAGGGLALTLLSMQSAASVAHGTAPAVAAGMSPWTDLALTGSSLKDRADADPLVTADMLAVTGASYLNGFDPLNPIASPLYGELDGLPPVQLHVGTDEVLLDDARRYAQRARTKGVDATLHVWQGMPHVFASNVDKLVAANQALEIIASFVKQGLNTHR